MTEAEWLACHEPPQLLRRWRLTEGAPPRAPARLVRLAGVACCRAVPGGFADADAWRAVELAERYADGRADTDAVAAAVGELWYHDGYTPWRLVRRQARELRVAVLLLQSVRHQARGFDAGRITRSDVCEAITLLSALHPGRGVDARWRQSDLIRCVLGNPFRPAASAPGWRTSNAVGLAEAIYERRAFHDLPILADALEDAGCDAADLLAHLRDPDAAHARGCWALDLVLGRG